MALRYRWQIEIEGTVDWAQCKDDFQEHDGLRDIYVLNADLEDWNAILPVLRFFDCNFYLDGEPAVIPESIDSAFFDNGLGKLLAANVSGIQVNCHFFSEYEIELDVDPREITGQNSLAAVLDLIQRMGQVLSKEVLLTPENGWRRPIFRYVPGSSSVEFCPA